MQFARIGGDVVVLTIAIGILNVKRSGAADRFVARRIAPRWRLLVGVLGRGVQPVVLDQDHLPIPTHAAATLLTRRPPHANRRTSEPDRRNDQASAAGRIVSGRRTHRCVLGWALASAGPAPIAGATLTASQQPAADTQHDQRRGRTRRVTNRWIMTASMPTVGVCYLVTTIGLSKVNTLGRAVFGFGGGATVVVALPQPTSGNVPAAGIAFVALALWAAVSDAPTRR